MANYIVGIIAQIIKDNSIVDIVWGLLFIIPNLVGLLITMNWNARTILVFSMICIWGLRLAIHIGSRHTRGEDYRYVEMRQDWMKKGKCNYYFRTFVFIFSMQALFSLIVNSSALYVTIFSPKTDLNAIDIVGAVIWVFGFGFEVIGDWQLQ